LVELTRCLKEGIPARWSAWMTAEGSPSPRSPRVVRRRCSHPLEDPLQACIVGAAVPLEDKKRGVEEAANPRTRKLRKIAARTCASARAPRGPWTTGDPATRSRHAPGAHRRMRRAHGLDGQTRHRPTTTFTQAVPSVEPWTNAPVGWQGEPTQSHSAGLVTIRKTITTTSTASTPPTAAPRLASRAYSAVSTSPASAITVCRCRIGE